MSERTSVFRCTNSVQETLNAESDTKKNGSDGYMQSVFVATGIHFVLNGYRKLGCRKNGDLYETKILRMRKPSL